MLDFDFPERLKTLRKRMGLSQTAFAALGGVTKGSQIGYEQGRNDPAGSYFAKLAESGIDILWLLTGRTAEAGREWDELLDLVTVWRRLPAESQAAVLEFMAWQDWRRARHEQDTHAKTPEDHEADAQMLRAGMKALAEGRLDDVMRRSREALQELKDDEEGR